jgi:integrase
MNGATLATYKSAFGVYEKWCGENGRSVLPTNPIQLAEYVAWLGGEVEGRNPRSYAASSIIKHVSAVKHFHVTGAHPSLKLMQGYDLLEKVVKVAKAGAIQAKPKEALMLEDLDKLCEVLTEKKDISEVVDIGRVRAGCAFFLLFVGGFRVGELVNLKWVDLTEKKMNDVAVEYLEVAVEKRKNDKRGQRVTVPSIDKAWNPVRWVSRLKEMASKGGSGLPTYVFNNTTAKEDVHIQPSTVNHWFKNWVGKVGLNAKSYGTHSGRRGGATALARAGASAGELKAYGGWKSDTFKRYIQEMPEEKKKAALLLKKAADGKVLNVAGMEEGVKDLKGSKESAVKDLRAIEEFERFNGELKEALVHMIADEF